MNALEVRGLAAGYDACRIVTGTGTGTGTGTELILACGEWLCLIGPDGAGKSTLLNCIGGRLQPMSGSTAIAGHRLDLEACSARSRPGFGVMPDHLPGLRTGRQCMEVHALAQKPGRIDRDVMALTEELPPGSALDTFIDTFIDTWSSGMQQKLAILLTLLGDPALIVLDEAFNGLDPRSAIRLRGLAGKWPHPEDVAG